MLEIRPFVSAIFKKIHVRVRDFKYFHFVPLDGDLPITYITSKAIIRHKKACLFKTVAVHPCYHRITYQTMFKSMYSFKVMCTHLLGTLV